MTWVVAIYLTHPHINWEENLNGGFSRSCWPKGTPVRIVLIANWGRNPTLDVHGTISWAGLYKNTAILLNWSKQAGSIHSLFLSALGYRCAMWLATCVPALISLKWYSGILEKNLSFSFCCFCQDVCPRGRNGIRMPSFLLLPPWQQQVFFLPLWLLFCFVLGLDHVASHMIDQWSISIAFFLL